VLIREMRPKRASNIVIPHSQLARQTMSRHVPTIDRNIMVSLDLHAKKPCHGVLFR
jgi:hypothetical protein